MKFLLLFLPFIFLSCASGPSAQEMLNNYSNQVNQAVQNGQLEYPEGEKLKLQYMNQLNEQANNNYYQNQAYAQNLRQVGEARSARYKSQSSQRTSCESYQLGERIYTDCH